ncbi:unnamed protein product [Notodromas monacha]|uniref:Uncharacterized protein n=1 Tax=Notodromas monacha TaxID=399045 RepID=A0A7R9GG97_9CRUS|nr:unnamed protein product [Notodromas monacha]CAG0920139.1 unnamed protein product [Notodromas monacha]
MTQLPVGAVIWMNKEHYIPVRHRVENRVFTDKQGVRWRKEIQEATLRNHTLQREETMRHTATYLEPRPPVQVAEGRLKCGPCDRLVIVVEKLYHTEGIRHLIRMKNLDTGEEKFFRRNQFTDDEMVKELIHGAKQAIGETIGHTSLPDTMGHFEHVLNHLPVDEEDKMAARKILTGKAQTLPAEKPADEPSAPLNIPITRKAPESPYIKTLIPSLKPLRSAEAEETKPLISPKAFRTDHWKKELMPTTDQILRKLEKLSPRQPQRKLSKIRPGNSGCSQNAAVLA